MNNQVWLCINAALPACTVHQRALKYLRLQFGPYVAFWLYWTFPVGARVHSPVTTYCTSLFQNRHNCHT
jgi:hypothetical protein